MAWNIVSRKARSPHRRCGLPVACFSEGEAIRRTRLPVALLSQAGGKNPVYRPFLLARPLLYPSTVRTFGYAPVGHGTRPSANCLRCWHALAELPLE